MAVKQDHRPPGTEPKVAATPDRPRLLPVEAVAWVRHPPLRAMLLVGMAGRSHQVAKTA